MAHPPLQKSVSTLEALISSISIDRQVYLWFSHLIRHPEIRSALLLIPDVKDLYQKIHGTTTLQRILYTIFAGLISCAVMASNPFAFGAGILFVLPFAKLHLLKKGAVSEISRHFLLREFDPADIPQKTLYQIAEICAKKYSLHSLVDFIAAMDKHCRRAIVFAFLFTCILYPIHHLAVVLASPVLAYFAVSLLAGTSFYFKKLVQ